MRGQLLALTPSWHWLPLVPGPLLVLATLMALAPSTPALSDMVPLALALSALACVVVRPPLKLAPLLAFCPPLSLGHFTALALFWPWSPLGPSPLLPWPPLAPVPLLALLAPSQPCPPFGLVPSLTLTPCSRDIINIGDIGDPVTSINHFHLLSCPVFGWDT